MVLCTAIAEWACPVWPRALMLEGLPRVPGQVRRMKLAGYRIGNMDSTIILQRPKLSPHKAAIKANLCALLDVSVRRTRGSSLPPAKPFEVQKMCCTWAPGHAQGMLGHAPPARHCLFVQHCLR